MTKIYIKDVDIEFPFEGYACQVEYMRSVVDALQSGSNALLESPTGTGKTLCLLCASLAWLLRTKQSHKICFASTGKHTQFPHDPNVGKNVARPKIIYCSRTHTQLAQVIRELKRTCYSSEVRMALLGSREHMCVNTEVTRLPSAQAQQSMCDHLRGNKGCRFFRGLQAKNCEAFLSADRAVYDMEDLTMEGKKSVFCPYYLAREESKDADIVFMPYNYILDPLLRKQLPFDTQGAVLIVDEAHNLPSVLSSSGCLNLQPIDLVHAINECARAVAVQQLIIEKEEEMDAQAESMREQEFAALKILLCQLESIIAEEPMIESHPSRRIATQDAVQTLEASELVRSGAYMREFLSKALITDETFNGKPGSTGMNDVITAAITMLSKTEKAASGLPQVQHFLSTVFSSDSDKSVRFIIQESKDTNDSRSVRRVLGYWKLDNSQELLELSHRFHSLLLTSGTLSPVDHFAADMGIPFQVRLQGSHVIHPQQLIASVLCKTPFGGRLNGSYVFRTSIEYRLGIGISLVNVSRNIPGGTLVFFPSYTAMRTAVSLWQTHIDQRFGESKTIWGLLSELKPVFVEPGETSELAEVVEGYQKAIDAYPRKGAIFLAVCRGKISEGVDFADNHGRCVLVTGIPFANTTDLFVRLKRDYLTQIAPRRPLVDNKPYTGECWYRNEAMRAVNQCIGRVIRHKDDYGVVVLADERFEQHVRNLSPWISARTQVHHDFKECYVSLSRFFSSRGLHGVNDSARYASRPDIPFERGSTSAGIAASVCLPSSADHAKSFAIQKELKTEEEKQALQRRRLEEANEHPSRVRPSSAEKIGSVSDSPSAHFSPDNRANHDAHVPIALPKMQRQKLVVFSEQALTQLAPKGLTLDSTSKEFCTFLRKRVSALSYENFKIILKELALLRQSAKEQNVIKERLTGILDKLTIIFIEADANALPLALEVFSRHIPEEFRELYRDLIHPKIKENKVRLN